MSLKNEGFSASEFIYMILKLVAMTGIHIFHKESFENTLFNLKKNIGQLGLMWLMKDIDFYWRNHRYFSDEVDNAFTELQNSKIISFVNPHYLGFEYLGDKSKKNRAGRSEYIAKILIKQFKKFKSFKDLHFKQFLKLTEIFLKFYDEEIKQLENNEFSKDICREFISHWKKNKRL